MQSSKLEGANTAEKRWEKKERVRNREVERLKKKKEARVMR